MPAIRPPYVFGLTGFALALALRLASLDHRTLWVDEALTQYAVSLDWAALMRDRIAAGHSPLYFLAMKALGIAPGDIHALRIASALMDSAACGVLGRRWRALSGAGRRCWRCCFMPCIRSCCSGARTRDPMA
jgi:hypothetical protein